MIIRGRYRNDSAYCAQGDPAKTESLISSQVENTRFSRRGAEALRRAKAEFSALARKNHFKPQTAIALLVLIPRSGKIFVVYSAPLRLCAMHGFVIVFSGSVQSTTPCHL